MADWKSTIAKVATDLGFRSSDKPKKKQGIDLSRWFPEKTKTASPVKAQSEIVTKSQLPVRPSLPKAVPPIANAKPIGLAIPASPNVPKSVQIAPANARLPKSPVHPPPAIPVRKQVAKVASQPAKVSASKAFQFPDISELVIHFPDCHARSDWKNSAVPTIEDSSNVGEWVCVLGLDFGTAFTKACVGLRGKHYFVHWDQCVDYPQTYLLPTFMTELEDGRCVLGAVPGSTGIVHAGLKMALLNSPTDQQQGFAVTFFALVMQYVRAWIWTKHRDVIAGFQLKWLINIGLPTSHWDTEHPAPDLFRRAALAGWRLSYSSEPISVRAARAELSAVEHETQAYPARAKRELEQIEAFPEFGAQIHSYSTASQSRRDLHLMVDIGAGTVDIVTFHIGRDEEDELNAIMDSSIETAGTHVLLQNRLNAAGIGNLSWNDADTRLSIDEFEENQQLVAGTVRGRENEFAELLGRRIREVLSRTKTRRYASAPNWDGLPCFLAGGGRDVDVYRNSPDEGVRNLLVKLQPMRFPLPDKASLELAGLPDSDFHRVSVAHGLSFDPFNIKRTCRKKESQDLHQRTSSKPSFSDSFIDKSQV